MRERRTVLQLMQSNNKLTDAANKGPSPER